MIGMWELGVGMPHLENGLIAQVGGHPIEILYIPAFLGVGPDAEN